MSRYILSPEKFVDPAKHWITIGWDRPRQTYFAQIHDRAIVTERFRTFDDSVSLIAWLGDQPGQYPDVDAFTAALAPYANLAPGMRQMLISDQQGGVL